FEGRMRFKDHLYIYPDKSFYGYSSEPDSFIRMMGNVNDRVYLGDPRYPMSINADRVITANIGGESYYVGVVPNNPKWEKPDLKSGWTASTSRPPGFIKVQDKVTIRGWYVGVNGGTGGANPIFT